MLNVLNLHRLLELVFLTVPFYSNRRHVSDILIENKHQPLNALYQKDKHSDAVDWSVRSNAVEHWKRKTSALFNK